MSCQKIQRALTASTTSGFTLYHNTLQILPAFLWAWDKVAMSEWGISMGLGKSFEQKLIDFYREHNPGKIAQVPSIARKYKGREEQLFAKLEHMYEIREQARREEEEYADD